jgi:hypothetical protein
VLQALNEMAPGKVSRRLDEPLWIGLADAVLASDVASGSGEREVDVEPWYELDPQFSFHRVEQGQVVACSAWRPRAIRLSNLPRSPQVRDTSNARLSWCTQLFGQRVGNTFESPSDRVGIARLVDRLAVYTHASQSAATVRRYAVASNVSLRVANGSATVDHTALWRFTRNEQPCGVGFEIEVDALCFHMKLPSSPSATLLAADPGIIRALRTARYQWEAKHGPTLAAVAANVFLRDWLAQIFKVAAVTMAQEEQCELAEAIDRLRAPSEGSRLQAVLIAVFQSTDAPQDDDVPAHEMEPRLHVKLREAFADAATRDALATLANSSWLTPSTRLGTNGFTKLRCRPLRLP